MKKAYQYLFYKIYQFSEASPSRWLSDWKASFVIDILWLLLFTSIVNYYKAFYDGSSAFGEGILFFVLLLVVSVSNYFIFHHHQQWKNHLKEFNKLTKKENTFGGWIVFSLTVFVVFNFIASFYFYYQS